MGCEKSLDLAKNYIRHAYFKATKKVAQNLHSGNLSVSFNFYAKKLSSSALELSNVRLLHPNPELSRFRLSVLHDGFYNQHNMRAPKRQILK